MSNLEERSLSPISNDEGLRRATHQAIALNPESAFAYVGGMYIGSVQFKEALQYAVRQDPARTFHLLERRKQYYDEQGRKEPLGKHQLDNLQILEAAINAVKLCLPRQGTQQAVSGTMSCVAN